MEYLSIKEILQECHKGPESIEEFVLDLKKRNLSNDWFLKNIEVVKKSLLSEDTNEVDIEDLTKYLKAMQIIIDQRKSNAL